MPIPAVRAISGAHTPRSGGKNRSPPSTAGLPLGGRKSGETPEGKKRLAAKELGGVGTSLRLPARCSAPGGPEEADVHRAEVEHAEDAGEDDEEVEDVPDLGRARRHSTSIMCIHVYTYIYIFLEREREKER